MSGEGGAIAEVLAAHVRKSGPHDDGLPTLDVRCTCGWTHPDRFIDNADLHRAHVADVLADLLAAERQRGREEALREAAKEAEERGDIGKDGGCEAWTWLRIRADRIAETP